MGHLRLRQRSQRRGLPVCHRARIGVALLGAALAVALPAADALRPLELASVDARFSIRGAQPQRLRGLLLVAIDARADSVIGPWPIRRRYYARALARLREADARQVAIDVQFTEPADTRDDDALILGLRRTPGTVLVTTDTEPDGGNDVLGGRATQRYARVRVASVVLPIDTAGTYRRFDPVERGLRTLPLVVARALQPQFRPSLLGQGRVWIDYAGGPGTVPTVSMLALLRGRVPASEIRGRTVLIGNTDPAVQDLHAYSALSDHRMAGTEIEANAVATALEHAPLRGIAGWLAALLTLACGLGPVLAVGRRLRWGVLGVTAALLAVLGLAQLAFDSGRIVPVADPLVTLVVTGAAALPASFVLEIRARGEQVMVARRRAVAAADEARRRVERDLHDGVQQRLVALAMNLAAPGAADRPELLPGAVEQLRLALDELRQLARGAYPAVLREAGLEGALQSLADRAPMPVTLTGGPPGELGEQSARAAYFVAAEALANAGKHAAASQVRFELARAGAELRLVVRDDGRGGADAQGSGLRGLAERAEAAGGTLTVTSPPGAGTTIELRIPA